MNNEQKLIHDCFKCLHLDERASQREVELAFETLTKNSDKKNYSNYRKAFEYLMYNVFNVRGEENIQNNIQTNNTTTNTENNTSNTLIEYVKNNYIELPLFCEILNKHANKVFGTKYWTEDGIKFALMESNINGIQFSDLSIDMSSSYPSIRNAVQDFVYNLKKMYCNNAVLCKKFEIADTSIGVTAHCIAESNLARQLKELVELKGQQLDCSYYTSLEREI